MATTQEKIKVVGEGNLTSKFPNFRPFDTATSVTLFNMGTSRVTSNLGPSVVSSHSSKIVTMAERVTLEDLRIKSLDKARTIRQYTDKIFLRPDRTDMTSYSYFGSLVEHFRVSFEQIIKTWPGSLYGNPYIAINNNNASTYTPIPTVSGVSYNIPKNVTTFVITDIGCENEFGINLNNSDSASFKSGDLKDLTTEFTRYSLEYNKDVFPLVGFSGLSSGSTHYIRVQVKGKAFSDVSGTQPVARTFHIRPSDDELNLYQHTISDLGSYLLSLGGISRFTTLFRYPGEYDDDVIEKTVTWPCSDGFNPDLTGDAFLEYQEMLYAIAQAYDNTKTNLILRRLVPVSLLDNDQTENGKMSQLLQVYGREFDKVKSFIDGIAHLNTLTYDRLNNAPDALVLNLARTLGWDTFPIASDENSVVNALFTPSTKYGEETLTPAEVDIELWRRIAINSTWLFQSKGTRHALEAILGLVGAPEELVEFSEYIYLAQKRVRVTTELLEVKGFSSASYNQNIAIASNTAVNTAQALGASVKKFDPQAINKLYTDADSVISDNDGNVLVINSLNEQVINPETPIPPLFVPFQNIGDDSYMKAIADEGFILTKTVDNKKSWLVSTGTTRYHERTDTQYDQADSKMVVNSKEMSISLNPAKAIEYDIYDAFRAYGTPNVLRILPPPYPILSAVFFNVTKQSFSQFVSSAYNTFIDARNRKTSLAYPTLMKLYHDYIRKNGAVFSGASALTNSRIMAFVKRISGNWFQLLEQMIPATTILTDVGVHIRNSEFQSQKFVYRAGLNAGSEFASPIPVNNTESIYIAEIDGEVQEDISEYIYIAEIEGEGYASLTSQINTPYFSNFATRVRPEPKAIMESYYFNPPLFNVSGASKITSIENGAAVYNYSTSNSKTVDFLFDSDARDIIQGVAGADFGYLVYPYVQSKAGFDTKPVFRQYFGRNTLSGITSGGTFAVRGTIPQNILEPNREYLIKGFYSKPISLRNTVSPSYNQPYSYYDNFVENVYPLQFRNDPKFYNRATQTPLTGITLSNELKSIPPIGLGLPYQIYDAKTDYYFVSVGKPQTPTPTFKSGLIEYKTEYFTGTTNPVVTGFTLTEVPLAGLQIFRNNVEVFEEMENGFYTNNKFVGAASGLDFILRTPLSTGEVITVSYFTAHQKVKLVTKEFLIPEDGVKNGYGNTNNIESALYYNKATGNLEVTLNTSFPMPDSISIEEEGYMITGATIGKPGILVPNYIPHPNGKVILRYREYDSSALEAWPLKMQPTRVDFSIPSPLPSDAKGYFTIEIATKTDYKFDTVLFAYNTPYIPNTSQFSATFDLSKTAGIEPSTQYLLRIVSHKHFETIQGDTLDSISESKVYLVELGTLSNPSINYEFNAKDSDSVSIGIIPRDTAVKTSGEVTGEEHITYYPTENN